MLSMKSLCLIYHLAQLMMKVTHTKVPGDEKLMRKFIHTVTTCSHMVLDV